MSSLVVGFAAQMCKQASNAQGEATLSFEVQTANAQDGLT